MSIDWSKAPEGANKAGFTGHDQYLQFYRIPGMFGDYDYWSEKRGWCGNDFPTCANYLFDRPEKVEWDGQGLPPVGTVCERRTLPGNDGRYEQVRIIAHTRKGFPVWENTDGVFAGISKFPHLVGGRPEFRPIRTHEQIAAEEREAGISDMQTITDGAGPTVYAKLSALYDAGYRRQEEGK